MSKQHATTTHDISVSKMGADCVELHSTTEIVPGAVPSFQGAHPGAAGGAERHQGEPHISLSLSAAVYGAISNMLTSQSRRAQMPVVRNQYAHEACVGSAHPCWRCQPLSRIEEDAVLTRRCSRDTLSVCPKTCHLNGADLGPGIRHRACSLRSWHGWSHPLSLDVSLPSSMPCVLNVPAGLAAGAAHAGAGGATACRHDAPAHHLHPTLQDGAGAALSNERPATGHPYLGPASGSESGKEDT